MQLDLLRLLGLILAFAVIIVLVMRRFNYGLALIFGSLFLGIFGGFSLSNFVQVFLVTLADPITYELALVTALIPILAHCMKETGMIEDLLGSLKGFLSGRAILATIPAIFGLLPMTGGALFSAPMIDSEAKKMRVKADLKSLINVWFRHCMFFVNPISPVIILASRLSGVGLFDLILLQIPIFVVYIIAGYIFSISSIKSSSKGPENSCFPRSVLFSVSISPILLVILLIAFGVPMALALVIGIVLVLGLKRVNYRKALALVWRGFDWRLVFAIFGVMLFSHMIEASGGASSITSSIQSAEIYPLPFLLLLSCFTGVTTAAPSIGIGVAISMAVQMFGNLNPIMVSMLYQSVVFSYIVSPMHLCLILTVEYYKARLQDVYRLLIPLASFVCLTGLMLAYGLLMYL